MNWDKPNAVVPKGPTQIGEWKCNLCSGTGVLLALRKDVSTGPYAFRCSCYRGQNDRRKHYPSWRDADKTTYALMGNYGEAE